MSIHFAIPIVFFRKGCNARVILLVTFGYIAVTFWLHYCVYWDVSEREVIRYVHLSLALIGDKYCHRTRRKKNMVLYRESLYVVLYHGSCGIIPRKSCYYPSTMPP